MSASDASTACQGRDARQTLPISCYSRMSFSSLYVAEPDSNRPAHFVQPYCFTANCNEVTYTLLLDQ
jgi:hypothetical protein